MLVMPVSLIMSLVGLFRDERKGWAGAGVLLSLLPFWFSAVCS